MRLAFPLGLRLLEYGPPLFARRWSRFSDARDRRRRGPTSRRSSTPAACAPRWSRVARSRLPRLLPASRRCWRIWASTGRAARRADAPARGAASQVSRPAERRMKVVLYFRIKEVRWTVGDDELRAVAGALPAGRVRAGDRGRRAARGARRRRRLLRLPLPARAVRGRAGACAGSTPRRPASRPTCSPPWSRATWCSPTPPACTP